MNNVVPIQRDFSPQQLKLVKGTVAKDCNDQEFNLFMEVCRRVGLDPFRKQIYAIVTSKDNPQKRQLVIVTGIDGYRAVAARSGDYRPDDKAPRYLIDEAAKDPETNPLGIVSVEVSCFKKSGDDWFEVVGIAHWEEFAPIVEEWAWSEEKGKKLPTGKFALDSRKQNWRKQGRVMIAKCAEAQALRRGWPETLSGIYAEDEMDQTEMRDITPSEAIEEADKEARLVAVGGKDTVPILWAAGDPLVAEPIGSLADKCMDFIARAEVSPQLTAWRDTNRIGLQQFWAKAAGDALEVKKALEAKIEALNTETETT